MGTHAASMFLFLFMLVMWELNPLLLLLVLVLVVVLVLVLVLVLLLLLLLLLLGDGHLGELWVGRRNRFSIKFLWISYGFLMDFLWILCVGI